jgi:uncharacterized damage-inducible protein DinB
MYKTNTLLFIIFCFGAYLSNAQALDSLILEAAIKKLENAKTYTLKVAELMPAENYSFKPTKEEMSFARQLLHLAENLGWLTSSYLRQDQNPVNKKELTLTSKDSVISVVNRSYDYALATIKSFHPNSLADPVKFFAGPMNKLQIINLINDHQTHHRAQLIVYLRLKGIKPPSYVGW